MSDDKLKESIRIEDPALYAIIKDQPLAGFEVTAGSVTARTGLRTTAVPFNGIGERLRLAFPGTRSPETSRLKRLSDAQP